MILLKDLYQNKKVVIIANGNSLLKHSIDFSKFDVAIGLNRIYQTPLFEHINLLYYGCGKKDWHNLESMIKQLSTKTNLYGFIASPWFLKYNKKILLHKLVNKYQLRNKFIYSTNILRKLTNKGGHSGRIKKRPLIGIGALNHVLEHNPLSIDIYGYDFYEQESIYNLTQYKEMTSKNHDLQENKDFLEKLITQNLEKISWYK